MTKTIELVKELIKNTRFKLANETTVKDIANICEAYHEQAILSQGDPVAFRYKHKDDLQWQYTNKIEVISVENIIVENLYTFPPSTEALKKDKAEMIAYARKLYSKFDFIKGYAKDLEEAENEAKQALAIPKPKCME